MNENNQPVKFNSNLGLPVHGCIAFYTAALLGEGGYGMWSVDCLSSANMLSSPLSCQTLKSVCCSTY